MPKNLIYLDINLENSDMIDFFGYAFGLAGSNQLTGEGPIVIKNSDYSATLEFEHRWQILVEGKSNDVITELKNCGQELIYNLCQSSNKFCVFGGDHTSAIATMQAAKKKHDRLKIMWIDAHMDLHNLASSHSKNIHGMSLGVLLGQADADLLKVHDKSLTIKPEDVCLFGVRSYEQEERQRLEQLGINIVYMQEITQNGLINSWQNALDKLNIGINDKLAFSIDLDVFDPKFAPAVTVPENDGINPNDLISALKLSKDVWQPRFIGSEIVEFAPKNDLDHTTEKLIFDLLNALYS